MNTKNPLKKLLNLYCNVNAFDIQQLSDDIKKERLSKNEADIFKLQLAEAILQNTLTPENYKKITGDNEYNTQCELENWLREIWKEIYKDEPISLIS
jgi:hypothetical protein